MATNVNLYIDQGTTYAARIVVHHRNESPVDLTGMDVRVQMRRSMTSSTVYTFDVVLEDAPNGSIILAMSSAYTTTLPSGRYVFDGEYTDLNGNVYKFISGLVTVYPTVTR